MKSFERREKVAKAIQREVAQLIQTGAVKDDRIEGFVSIVDVDLNSSLSSAKVLYSVMNLVNPEAAQAGINAALNDKAGYIRGIVGRRLNLKYAPKLIFIESKSLAQTVDLIDLINKTVREDNERHA